VCPQSYTVGMKLVLLLHLSSESNWFLLEVFFRLAEHLTTSILCLLTSGSLSVSGYDWCESSTLLCFDLQVCRIFETGNVFQLPCALVLGAVSVVYRIPWFHSICANNSCYLLTKTIGTVRHSCNTQYTKEENRLLTELSYVCGPYSVVTICWGAYMRQ
jgi:hypothetical protein